MVVEKAAANQPPQPDFTYQCNDLSCSFDASGSIDSDGQVVHWNWTFGDGTTATGRSANHSYESDGNYTVQLDVTDNDGASGKRTRSVHVSVQERPNTAPYAKFAYSCDELACEFNASASSDSDGSIAEVSWNFGDGTGATGQHTNHLFARPGTYEVTLTVKDDEGAVDSVSRTLRAEETTPTIQLTGAGSRFNGRSLASLSWAGAESGSVEIYRDGRLVQTTSNDGKHIDTDLGPNSKTAVYRVCQPGAAYCSNQLTLYFTP